MPIYQYECEACDHAFEELQTMTAPKLTKCPACGKNKLVRLIGAGAGMIFKGSGFYETDYKSKPAPASESKSSASAGGKSCCSTPSSCDC